MGLLTVNDPPYNAVGDGVADDTCAIQQALDDGYALLAPTNRNGWYRTTATLNVPASAALVGASRHQSIIAPDDVVGSAVRTVPSENQQVIKNLQISGKADIALEVNRSNIVKVDSIRIGRDFAAQPFLPQASFTTGVVFNLCFSSSMNNIAVVGTQIVDYCCHIRGAFNGNTMSNFQTSTFCKANLRIDNSEGGQNQGSHFDALVLQGGDRGLDIQNCSGLSFSGVYTENTVLPIVIGNDDGQLRTSAIKLAGLFLIGPAKSHPNFGNRTAHIEIRSATAVTIEDANLVSYDQGKIPRLDGIWYLNPTNSVISSIHGVAALFLPREQMIKRFVNASGLAGFRLDSTDSASRQTQVIKSTDAQFEFQICKYRATGLTTETYIMNYAVRPPLGAVSLTEHEDATSYDVNDSVYVGAAAVDGGVYRCVTAGVSGTGTPPTGAGAGISDGSVVWDFHGVLV